MLAERDAAWQRTRGYLYDVGSFSPLQVEDSNGVYQAITDHLGTPQQLTNDAGEVVWDASYEPFGKAEALEDPDGDGVSIGQNIRFPGQYFDQETGNHYNYKRYYSPLTGGYISSDPIGLSSGLNLYAYASHDPVNSFDPNGELPLVVVLPFAGGIINGAFSAYNEECGSRWAAFGRGFASGFVATSVGLVAGFYGANPYIAGAAGGLAGDITEQLLSGHSITSLDPISAGFATITGGAFGKLSTKVFRLRGRAPYLTRSRWHLSEWGRNSRRLVGQEVFGGVTGGVAGTVFGDAYSSGK